MPELPEVETVRRSLLPHVGGRRITAVEVHRPQVVRGGHSPQALMRGLVVTGIDRRGKHLLISAGPQSPCICVHLGMTGSLRFCPPGAGPGRGDHVHVRWRFGNHGHMEFRDPRRFGGVWSFNTPEAAMRARWSSLGPDALIIRPRDLHSRLTRTGRGLKAALLDQSVVAGLGNIYADELLFALRLHPQHPANRLSAAQVQQMVYAMRRLLARAIAARGSSVRDYHDAEGNHGSYAALHQVYGRGGQPCTSCGAALQRQTIAGRTTVFCRQCQQLC
jgi:formamidopyrimidine-DNA glycosylase